MLPLSLKTALGALAAHKLRTALAVLGVFLGALALTGVQHLGLAMAQKAEQETERLGPNLLMASAGQVRLRRSGSVGVSGRSRTFTQADARALVAGIPGALDGTPYSVGRSPVIHGETRVTSQIVGAWPNYRDVRALELAQGRFHTLEEERAAAKVCVLGASVAERLFGGPERALGNTVRIGRTPARVVGVLAPKGADISGADQDDQVVVPLSAYLRRLNNFDWVDGAYLTLAKGVDTEAAKASAEAILRLRHRIQHGEKDDFSVITAADAVRVRRQALDLVNTLGMISSSVSFAVGGLGILSMMTLLVRLRRLEIGIRRALGAKRGHIVRQFLAEAGLMSAAGGGLGVLAAAALVSVVYAVADFPFVYSPLLLAGTLAGSGALGLAAGAYPAWRASRLEVLDVLKGSE